MLEVSKKGNRTSRTGVPLHLVQLWIDEDKYQQIRRAADSVQEPVTTWIRRAVFASLRKWEIPEARALLDPCSICGKRHDEKVHFAQD